MTTSFLYIEATTCHICAIKTPLAVLTLKICKANRECLAVFSCLDCAKFKPKDALSCAPFNNLKGVDALASWLRSIICVTDSIPSFVQECNKNKTVALKTMSRALFKTCTHCKAKQSKFRCSNCHYLRFCSEECAKSEWNNKDSHHKAHCKTIGNAAFIRNFSHQK